MRKNAVIFRARDERFGGSCPCTKNTRTSRGQSANNTTLDNPIRRKERERERDDFPEPTPPRAFEKFISAFAPFFAATERPPTHRARVSRPELERDRNQRETGTRERLEPEPGRAWPGGGLETTSLSTDLQRPRVFLVLDVTRPRAGRFGLWTVLRDRTVRTSAGHPSLGLLGRVSTILKNPTDLDTPRRRGQARASRTRPSPSSASARRGSS